MMFKVLFLWVAIALIMQTALAVSEDEETFFPCVYTSRGNKLDLTSFAGQVIIGDVQSTTRHYYLSLCKNLEDPCGHLESALCAKTPTGSFGISLASNSLPHPPAPEAKYFSESGETGFLLSYANSDDICEKGDATVKFKVGMKLICSSEADITHTFEMTEVEECEYSLSLKHPQFCGTSSGSSGLSGGAIFLIIVFSVLAAYFIIGFLVCKFYLKKPGCKESIPQHAFWCALPGLFVAGVRCTFSFFAAKCCGKRGGASRGTSSDDYESYGAVGEV